MKDKLRGVLQDLVVEEKEVKYPNMNEIKKVLKKALEVIPQEKCKRFQKLKIRKGEIHQKFQLA